MKIKILEQYRSNPQSFLEQIGVCDLKYSYREAIGCCPLHDESSPSFSINMNTGLWHCFAGCGSGDIFTLYKLIKSFSGNFYELLKEMENNL